MKNEPLRYSTYVAGHVAGYVTGTVDSFVYDGGIPDVDPTRLTVGSVRPPNPAFTRTFEFRLSGSEESEQAFDLPKIDTQRAIVTANNLRVYLSGGAPETEDRVIGGIEVRAKWRGSAMVCVAQVTDLAADGLVVVQVDVNVYLVA